MVVYEGMFGADMTDTQAPGMVNGTCKCPSGQAMAPNPGGRERWTAAAQAARAKGQMFAMPSCPDFRCVATSMTQPLTAAKTLVCPEGKVNIGKNGAVECAPETGGKWGCMPTKDNPKGECRGGVPQIGPAAPAIPGEEPSLGDRFEAAIAAHPYLWMGGAVLVAYLGGKYYDRTKPGPWA